MAQSQYYFRKAEKRMKIPKIILTPKELLSVDTNLDCSGVHSGYWKEYDKSVRQNPDERCWELMDFMQDNHHTYEINNDDQNAVWKLSDKSFDEAFDLDDSNSYETPSTFLHGHCDVFAHTLSASNPELWSIEKLEQPGGAGGSHYYCRANVNGQEMYADVRGITTDWKEFVREFDGTLQREDAYEAPDSPISQGIFYDREKMVSSGNIVDCGIGSEESLEKFDNSHVSLAKTVLGDNAVSYSKNVADLMSVMLPENEAAMMKTSPEMSLVTTKPNIDIELSI